MHFINDGSKKSLKEAIHVVNECCKACFITSPEKKMSYLSATGPRDGKRLKPTHASGRAAPARWARVVCIYNFAKDVGKGKGWKGPLMGHHFVELVW